MPASRVLLVDHDVDALAELAGVLRERGLKVSLANGSQMACERAKAGAYDVVIAAREVAEPLDGNLGVIDALSVELPQVPPLIVLVESETGTESDSRIVRKDVDRIIARIGELAKPPGNSDHPRHLSLAPSSHSLEHAPLADLLVVLSTERRSGTLTVSTSKGSGEVRIASGEVVDAVYVRLEGLKAITRMLSEREGTATFAPGAPAIMRRINVPTRALVEEARALAEKATELRERAGTLPNGTLIAADGSTGEALHAIDQHVLARLRVPAMLDELLDELPHSDADILDAAIRLDAKGRIKQLGHASSRVQLCGADQLHLVRASAARAKTPGTAAARPPLAFHDPSRRRRGARRRRIAARACIRAALADGPRRRSRRGASRRGRGPASRGGLRIRGRDHPRRARGVRRGRRVEPDPGRKPDPDSARRRHGLLSHRKATAFAPCSSRVPLSAIDPAKEIQ